MSVIELLDNNTIDKIAAGEVVERPASVVKELIENAMDSGADAITVEIKNGGIEFIRITDNGCGISKEDMPKAFLRHATSKISSIEDLEIVTSMGFRGEALASIASVSRVEMISKQPEELMGHKYVINGGIEDGLEEIGAPNGTTIIVRNLFYNTPARRKFLKSENAESSQIYDIVQHLSLCRPDISFTFITNNKTKISTSGNKDLKEVIYRIYGRDTAGEILPIDYNEDNITIKGFLGTPSLNRPTRNYETYFINRRFIQSNVVSRSIEEGYRAYLMQHKFPFCVLHIDMDTKELDVNVHPSKMEVRFHNKDIFFDIMSRAVSSTLANNEMIPKCTIDADISEKSGSPVKPVTEVHVEPFENKEKTYNNPLNISSKFASTSAIPKGSNEIFNLEFDQNDISNEAPVSYTETIFIDEPMETPKEESVSNKEDYLKITKENQFSIFDNEQVVSEAARNEYEVLGQVFDTYWIISFRDKLYFVDQHAAHEKVNYEKLMKRFRDNEVYSQSLNPPIIVTLTPKECSLLNEHMEIFTRIGFGVEEYGSNEYAIREVPFDLYSNNAKELFLDMMAECEEKGLVGDPEIIASRIATMACKASVKGGMRISRAEIEELLDQLLTLENPYHCPHGRPTIFSMSKYELEKKFKRIVD